MAIFTNLRIWVVQKGLIYRLRITLVTLKLSIIGILGQTRLHATVSAVLSNLFGQVNFLIWKALYT